MYLTQAMLSILTMICYAALKSAGSARQLPADRGGLSAVGEGIRFVFREKLVLGAMSLDLLAVLFGGATALLPIFAVDILHIGRDGLGWLRAAPAVGAGSMAFWLAHRPPIRHAGATLLAVVAGFGVATIGFAVSRAEWLSFRLLAATGALDSVSVVLRSYLVHSRTPDACAGASTRSMRCSSVPPTSGARWNRDWPRNGWARFPRWCSAARRRCWSRE